MDHIKVMPDEPTLKKNIQSMRRTASAAGFSDYEVATVYDPRMLDASLWKASKYDRMTASGPPSCSLGQGENVGPPARPTPLRMGMGAGQVSTMHSADWRRAAKISDAAEVFRFIT